jgi:hypothetical protein
MKAKIILSAIVASLLMIGCGSDSTDNSETVVKTAYYIDAPIENVNYVCGNQKGVTGSDGSFKYEEGSVCTFSIGGVFLRQTSSVLLDTNPKVFEDNLTIAQLLQSLDADNNVSNGITITEEEKEILKDYNDATDVQAIITEINSKTELNLSVLDIDTAKANLYASISDEIKNVLSNKVFYIPTYDDDTKKFVIDKVTVEHNATSIHIQPYNYESTPETDTLEINGTVLKINKPDGTANTFYFSEFNDKYVSLSNINEMLKLFYNANDAEDYVNDLNSLSNLGTYSGPMYYSSFNTYEYIKSGYITFKINDNSTGTVTVYNGSNTLTKNFDINYSDPYNPININDWRVGDVTYSLVASWNDTNQTIKGFIDVYDQKGLVIYFYDFAAGK